MRGVAGFRARAPLTPRQSALVAEHVPLAKTRARLWVRRMGGFLGLADDVHAAALLGLVYAAGGYEEGRGTTFGLWAKPWIDQAIRTELAKMRAPVAAPHHNKSIPLHRVFPRVGPEDDEAEAEAAMFGRLLNHTTDPSEAVDAERMERSFRKMLAWERRSHLYRPAKAGSVEDQADMFVRWLKGERGQDIAEDYGMHRSAFDQTLNRMYPAFERVARRLRNEAA